MFLGRDGEPGLTGLDGLAGVKGRKGERGITIGGERGKLNFCFVLTHIFSVSIFI